MPTALGLLRRAFVVLALSASACSTGAPPAAPGFDGPLPTAAARRTLDLLEGERLTVSAGLLPAGEFRLGGFAVLPNPLTGKSGGVALHRAEGKDAFLPLLVDGDVAELHRRVRGAVPAELAEAGAVSRAYAEALGL